jgi:sarcosine oxidase / L-pipecolate oxidase
LQKIGDGSWNSPDPDLSYNLVTRFLISLILPIATHDLDFCTTRASRFTLFISCRASKAVAATVNSIMALTTSFLIVGGGTFGTATAYELTQRGYTSVTVLDRSAPPSSEAAGNDLNKAVRADYADPLYVKMATEAIEAWRNPNGLFAGLYSRTGWILASQKDASEWIRTCSATAAELGVENAQETSSEQIKARWPVLRGPMADWSIFWNGSAGWANAREALNRVAKAAMNRGVNYISGAAGHVSCLLYDEHGRCIGARCRDGSAHYADNVVLAAGAYSPALLDLKGQLIAKGHSVGHIKLTKEEAKKYADMPLVAHMTGGN